MTVTISPDTDKLFAVLRRRYPPRLSPDARLVSVTTKSASCRRVTRTADRTLALGYEDVVSAAFAEQVLGHQNVHVGELERYEDSYQLWYPRGLDGVIIKLAERID